MYNFILENKDGQRLEFNNVGVDFRIVEIDGLYPPKALINTSETALIDGSMYNSSKVTNRTLKVAFSIENNAESNRARVYNVIQVKNAIRAYYKSDTRNVYIDGYVEALVVNHFDKKQIATATILCPEPYFKRAQEIINELTNVINNFRFPFHGSDDAPIVFGLLEDVVDVHIVNGGTVETGMTIELFAKGPISGPKIYNYLTQEYFGLNVSMETGDTITIKTGQGEKTVDLLRDGHHTNIFNTVEAGSTWLQLPANGGTFVYTVEEGNPLSLLVTFKHFDKYEGV